MASVKIINAVILASMLSSCAQLGPFVDRRREAGGLNDGALYVGKSTEKEPAICYNILFTKYEDVKKLADNECQKYKTGKQAIPVRETIFTCRLLVPNHYYFKCEN